MLLALYILVPMALLGLLVALALKPRGFGLGWRWALVASIAIILGGWITFDGLSRLNHGLETRDWPVTEGVVIEAKVEGERAFHPVIVYEYTVEGATFRDSSTLNQPSFGGRRRRKEVAETEKEQFTPGQDVVVHYDPRDPSRSNLGRVLKWSDYGRTGTGAVLFAVGLCFLLLYLFGRGKPDW